MRFYSHRWTENKLVAERAIEVWDDIVIDVKFWMSLPKSKQPSTDNKSCTQLKKAIIDLLIKMKFKFFAAFAKSLNSFFVTFQIENLMVPFLAQSIAEIIHHYALSF